MSRAALARDSEAIGASETPPRERILIAARDLFYRRGIRAVTVDEIAAEAKSNKMTLYRHFASKDLLAAEYLKRLAAETDASWMSLARQYPDDARAQLNAWIDQIGTTLCSEGNRGCAIANAAIEIPEKDHPARAIIESHKRRQRAEIVKRCRTAGFVQPDRLADEIFLLLEGACVNVQTVGRTGPGANIAEMLRKLLKTAPKK